MEKIPRGIVITTSEHTKDWLDECLKSLKDCKYPVTVVSNLYQTPKADIVNGWNGFELGGIYQGMRLYDEFVHLMDTCVVTDLKMFDLMFGEKGSVYLCDGFFSYLGKYKSDILNELGVPKIDSKADAIALEHVWNARYLKLDLDAKQFIEPLPIHTNNFEEKHGRKNMVLTNNYIIKYKGTWHL